MGSRDRTNIVNRAGAMCNSASARAKSGKLCVVKRDCPKCDSHKAFNTNTHILKCTKCGYDFKGVFNYGFN